MDDMMDDDVALGTIQHLERRLRRLEYLITGDTNLEATNAIQSPANPQPASGRLSQLERDFDRLCAKSKIIQDILQLHSRYPDLFEPIPPRETPTLLNTDELRSVVLAYADRFPTIASRLKSIFEMQVPPVEASMALVNLQPRIDRLHALQDEHGLEFLRLQRRSTAVLERWYTVSILGSGECWAEWDSRIAQAERKIRRAEVAKKREREER